MRPADVEELEVGPPEQIAIENARRKALTVASDDALVLGADTIVALGDQLYGKPADVGAARATLQALSGRAHQVIGGVCLLDGEGARTAVATTLVEFRALSGEVIEWYVASGEWHDRAGGYAIQGRGAALVKAIEGDYLNVVGLPVATLLELAPGLLS